MAKQKPTRRKPPSPRAGIDPKGLPTREQVRKGGYHVRAIAENGEGRQTTRAVRNYRSSPIMAAHAAGAITNRQRDAADYYYLLVKTTSATGYSRDCLDMSPRGGSNNVSEARLAYVADKHRERRSLEAHLPLLLRRAVYTAVIDEAPFGRRRRDVAAFRRCVDGLDMIADFRGMPPEPEVEDGG